MSISKSNTTTNNVRVIVSEKTTHSEHEVAKGHKYISVFSNFFMSSKCEKNKSNKTSTSSCN